MAKNSLTPNKKKIYDFIVSFKREHGGNSPTVREIADAVGIGSISVVHWYLRSLQGLGMIDLMGGARNIVVTGGIWIAPKKVN